MALIRCDKLTYNILIAKKEATGRPISKLLEYAVFNMPYIMVNKNENKTKRQ